MPCACGAVFAWLGGSHREAAFHQRCDRDKEGRCQVNWGADILSRRARPMPRSWGWIVPDIFSEE